MKNSHTSPTSLWDKALDFVIKYNLWGVLIAGAYVVAVFLLEVISGGTYTPRH